MCSLINVPSPDDDQPANSLPDVINMLRKLISEEGRRLDRFIQQRRHIEEWLDVPRVDQEYDDLLKSRLDGTCRWVFHHHVYLSWQPDEATTVLTGRILWIHGPPGYGKTVLCATIVESLKKEHIVAHVFCSPLAQDKNKPDVIVRIWISQLVRQSAVAHEVAKEQMERSAAVVSSKTELWGLLRRILQELPGCILALDGLDEFDRSEDRRAGVLQELTKAITHTDTRVLVVSREDIRPEMSFVAAGSADPILLECGISEEYVKDDVSKLSDDVVGKKLPSQQEDLKRKLADQMVDKAGGIFLWVKMQESQLEDYKSKATLEKLVNKVCVYPCRNYTSANETRRCQKVLIAFTTVPGEKS